MRFQQGECQSGRIKPVLAADQLERRRIRQLIALMRSDLMARRALVLGYVLPALHIRRQSGR
jgi:hypothetical protein